MSDEELLQGKWTIISLEVQGAAMSPAAFTGSQVIMDGNRFTTVSMGSTYGGTFTVDSESNPKRLDLNFTEGPHAGRSSLAIFQLDDDLLTLCIAFAGLERPTEFKTLPGTGHALESLRREPAMASGVSPSRVAPTGLPWAIAVKGTEFGPCRFPDELARLQGEWSMISGWMSGRALEKMMVSSGRRKVEGDEVTISFGGQIYLKARLTIDPTVSPKRMDYYVLTGPNAGLEMAGAYELTEDRLRLSTAAPGAARPEDLTPNLDDGRTVSEWKRRTG